MLVSRIVSFFAFSMALGGLALSKPVVEKPDLVAVQNIVTNLKSSTDTILPAIKDLAANKNLTEATVVPLMNQLIGAINNAHISLINAPRALPDALEKRQSASDIAALIAEILTDISTVLEDLLGSSASIPILETLIPALDAALTSLVTSLETVVTGLVTVLSGLLSTVSGLLGTVGLGLVLGLLGL